MAQRPGRTPLVPGDGRARHLPRARGALGRMALVAAGGPGAQPLAHARDRAGHAAGLHRGRGRVDGHRAGPAAVGDLRGSEDPRRGHPDAGAVVPFVTFTLLYCFLGVIVVWLLYRHIVRSPAVPEWRGFYMPPGSGERGGGSST